METLAHVCQLLADLIELETRTEDDYQLQLEGAISDDEYDRRFDWCCEGREAAEHAIFQASPTLLGGLPGAQAAALRRYLAAHDANQRDEDFDMRLVHGRERALEELSIALDVPGAAELHDRRERKRLEGEAGWARAEEKRPLRRRESIAQTIALLERGEPGDLLLLGEQVLRHWARPQQSPAPCLPALSEAHGAVVDLLARRTSNARAAERLRQALADFDAAEAREIQV